MTYRIRQYRDHVATLEPEAQVWKLVFTGALIIAGQIIATSAVFFAFAYAISSFSDSLYRVELLRVSSLQSRDSVLAILLTFSGWILAVWLGLRFLHSRRIRDVAAPIGRFGWGSFWRASLFFFTFGLLAFAATLPFMDYLPNLAPERWILWLIPALLAIFVQVYAEELVFRGYLQSMLAARFASPLVWIGVPTAMFGLLHLPTAMAFGKNAWLVLAAPTILGGIAAHLTARRGSIAAATALHFANNAIGILIVSVPGPLGMLSLYAYPFDPMDVETVRPMIVMNLAFILLAYAGYHVVIRLRDRRLQRGPRVIN
ncbi:CPBP family intramembrane glutamic endopeptidase [Oceanibium sediminis]|uniref:CPBP family intramembrane glutamic endopeptidase n=1 Tax=Oceanibium sediminis TaxID=2026339 RepID=UPI000DD3C3C2|nr:CPBP family intramembrane glutamic endopeptidase [Oceanibium sediminis]